MIKCKDCLFFKEGSCEKLKTEKDHIKLYLVILYEKMKESESELLNDSLKYATKSLQKFNEINHNYEKEPRENILIKEIDNLDIDRDLKKELIKQVQYLNLNEKPDKVYSANIEYLCEYLISKVGELILDLGRKETTKKSTYYSTKLYGKAIKSIDSHRLVEILTDKLNRPNLYGTLEINLHSASVIGIPDKKSKTLSKIVKTNNDNIQFTLQKFLEYSLDPLVVRNYCYSAIRNLKTESIESNESIVISEEDIVENVFLKIHDGLLTKVEASLISLIDIITYFSYFSLIKLSNSLQTHSEAEYAFRKNLFEKSKIEKIIQTELLDKDFSSKIVRHALADAKLLIARTQNSLIILNSLQKSLLKVLNKSEALKKLAKQELTCLKALPRFDINSANIIKKKTRSISI